MRRSILLSLMLCLMPGIATAQTNLSNVTVQWKENGVWRNNIFTPDATPTIRPDQGTPVNVVVRRTEDASLPAQFSLTDFSNNKFFSQTTNDYSVGFNNCAGPLDTDLNVIVNTNLGNVRISVRWRRPPLPDLAVSNISIDASIDPSYQNFHVGQAVDIRSIVWNVGGSEAGSSRLGYYINTSAGNTSGSPITWDNVPSISAGRGSNHQTSYTFTSNDVGTRYFVFEADYLNQVEEANENNNVASFGPFQVVAPPSLSFLPTAYNFGTIEVNSCSDEETFQLINDGGTTISGHIALFNTEHFIISSGGGNYTLNPGQTRDISLKLCPKSAGSKSTSLRIYVDGISSHYTQATISGNGVTPPESIVGISDEFTFDTRGPFANSGGIFLKVIETAGTNVVKEVGYNYSYFSKPSTPTGSTTLYKDQIKKVPVGEDGFVFLSPYDFPGNAEDIDDFNNEIFLFDENGHQIGHIAFSYSFEGEGMNSRHAVIFFHNDKDICEHPDGPPHYFPYSQDNPNNVPGKRYKYYQDGEYPLSMLIPPHFKEDEDEYNPQGYRFPASFESVQPLLFVHGLTGTFSYQTKHGAKPQNTETIGDQVSYWYHTERKVNHMHNANGKRKYHAWQFYYPNEDDLRHCAMTLRQAVNYLATQYKNNKNKFGIIAHSMGTLVTLEFLTTNTLEYNQEKIHKVLLSQPPAHGSLAANRVYWRDSPFYDIGDNAVGYLSGLFGLDPKAPCYRDLSIGSDFMYDLHYTRDWKALLDFNQSGSINENVFVLAGLTDREYRKSDLDKWYVPLKNINQAHTEALDHDDGLVSFSSASLLNKGIGLAGFYGNHDDGKFGADGIVGTLTHSNFMPNMINVYFESSNFSDFENYCLANSDVEIVVDGNLNVIKPGEKNLNNLSIDRQAVNVQKGMVTLTSELINEDNLYLFQRQPIYGTINPYNPDYVLSPKKEGPASSMDFHYIPKGRFIRNPSTLNDLHKNRYYFSRNNTFQLDTGFDIYAEYPFGVSLTYIDRKSKSAGYGLISSYDGSFLHYQTVTLIDEDPANILATESSPTKTIIPGLKKSTYSVNEIFVDDQTTLADFILYSEYADFYNIPYYISLVAPDGNSVDSNSVSTEYYRNPNTGLNILTIHEPDPGKWEIMAHVDSDMEVSSFTGLARFVSGIKARSLVDKGSHNVKTPVIISGFIEMPDMSAVEINSLKAYVEIEGNDGFFEVLQLDNIQPTDTGYIISNNFLADSTGMYYYTMVFEGVYNDYRFERAVYGEFGLDDLQPEFFIPDQEMDITNSLVDLLLPQYLHCPQCEPDNLSYEVLITSSTFIDDDIYYYFAPETNTLTLTITQEAPLAEAYFTVEAHSPDSLIASTDFRVRYSSPGVPSDLTASDLTLNSARLSWISRGGEGSWDILYGYSSFDPDSEGILIEGISNVPFLLEDLDYGTAYEFYVRAILEGDGNYSAWSWPKTFSTAYQVNVTINPEASGAVTGDGGHNMGDQVTLEATANPGYQFVNWTDDDGNALSGESSYTFTMPAENITLIANFEAKFIIVFIVGKEDGITKIQDAGITVTGEEKETITLVTDADGKAMIELPAGEYNYSLSADEYENLGGTFSVVDEDKEIIIILLHVGLVDPAENSSKVRIYPNPNDGLFQLEWTGSSETKLNVEVLNTAGILVYLNEFNAIVSLVEIDLSHLSKGVYFMVIKENYGVHIIRIIII
jgi:uncharacterized repeat protein (TIGR02543 family)